MASVKQYITHLRARQVVIARALGVDIWHTDKQTRVMLLSQLALLAVLIKTLTDKGVIADAELVDVLDAARDDVWPDEPINPT